jgi:uncharacterized protein Smg (DUF494 family)
MKTVFIHQLAEEVQNQIKAELNNLGFDQEDILNALDSRLSDLQDTIDISIYVGGQN